LKKKLVNFCCHQYKQIKILFEIKSWQKGQIKKNKKQKKRIHSKTTFMDIQDITKYEMVSVNRTSVPKTSLPE
jgi:hypothetical protein